LELGLKVTHAAECTARGGTKRDGCDESTSVPVGAD
jgi:hypothetical protein